MGNNSGTSTTTIDRWPTYFDRTGQIGTDPEGFPIIGYVGQVPLLPANYIGRAYSTAAAFLWDPLGVETFRSMVAPRSSEEITGTTRVANRGRNGSTTISKGKTLVNSVLDGAYLDGTIASFQATLSKVDTKSDSAFTADIVPKLGGSLYLIGDPAPDNLAQSLVSGSSSKYRSRMSAEMYAANYGFERKAQKEVLPVGGDYSDQEIVDAEMIRRAGLYDREYRQALNEDGYRFWMAQSENKIRRQEIVGHALRSQIGARTVIRTPYHRPSATGAIIGGVVGGTAGFFIGGPMGAAMGASLGMQAGQVIAS